MNSEKREETYLVLNRLFLKVGAWNKIILFNWFLLMTAVLIFELFDYNSLYVA